MSRRRGRPQSQFPGEFPTKEPVPPEPEKSILELVSRGSKSRLTYKTREFGGQWFVKDRGPNLVDATTGWTTKLYRLERDLTTALRELHSFGYQHNDKKARNVRWDGTNFYVVDYKTAALGGPRGGQQLQRYIEEEVGEFMQDIRNLLKRKGARSGDYKFKYSDTPALKPRKRDHRGARTEFEIAGKKCHVQCQKCRFVTGTGKRCSRKVCMQLDTCWQHLPLVHGVRVGPSTIPGAGKGLFAARYFTEGDKILPIKGVKYRQARFNRIFPGDKTHPNSVTDASLKTTDPTCKRWPWIYMNHSTRADQVEFGEKSIDVKKRKEIFPGQEIFINYGSQDEPYDLNNLMTIKKRSRKTGKRRNARWF